MQKTITRPWCDSVTNYSTLNKYLLSKMNGEINGTLGAPIPVKGDFKKNMR